MSVDTVTEARIVSARCRVGDALVDRNSRGGPRFLVLPQEKQEIVVCPRGTPDQRAVFLATSREADGRLR